MPPIVKNDDVNLSKTLGTVFLSSFLVSIVYMYTFKPMTFMTYKKQRLVYNNKTIISFSLFVSSFLSIMVIILGLRIDKKKYEFTEMF